MNSVWRDAWWLSKFEFVKTRGLFKLIMFALIFLFLLTALSNGSVNLATKIIFDWLFIVAVTSLPYSFRSKEDQLIRVSGDFWGCSSFNFLQEQPISEEVLLKSRFLSNSFQSLITNMILIGLLLVLPSKLNSTLSLGESITFLFFWLLISLMMSSLLSASDVGDIISMTKIIVFSIIIYGSILAMTITYYFYVKTSLVEGSIFLIKNYPVVTLVCAALLTIGSYLYWYQYAVKKVQTIDYL
ncbi:hypothetical protein [Bacillus sp. FJAT-42315]|uniref:hypothetical protein n=1 Tax=Bacillus sp. FJAT-42315 TaxID=2014077 RepID=UPI000C24C331|nr:hypothetical protein [Bacillus sp. FJAT-42315]